MPGTHKKYSPSGASRWLECPGSLSLPGEDRESVYAAEGTAAHALIHCCFLLGYDPAEFVGQSINGFEVDADMAEHVQLMLDVIEAEFDALPGDSKDVDMEVRFEYSRNSDFGGTIDCLVMSDQGFVIADYKHGVGVAVDIDDNPQLSCYAVLAREHWLKHYDRPVEDCRCVAMVIVQPRATHAQGPVRRQVLDNEYLDNFEAQLNSVFEMEVDVSNSEFFSAGDHCRWCPAKRECPHLHDLTIEIAQAEFDESSMTPERAAEILTQEKAIKAYLESISQWAHGQMDKGVPVPGFKLVTSLGNRRYKFGEDEVVKFCRNRKFGKRQITKSVLMSPAQLEKVIGKSLISKLVERPDKGTVLVPEHDKRGAVGPSSAADDFSLVAKDG